MAASCNMQVNSEFQAYKHIECMEPGELMRASSPLEAIIGMHPTLILTNALPYDIQVTVWQVSCPCTSWVQQCQLCAIHDWSLARTPLSVCCLGKNIGHSDAGVAMQRRTACAWSLCPAAPARLIGQSTGENEPF